MSIQTAIDAYLRDARELLGTGATPGNSRRPRTDMRPAQPQSWIGSAADSAGATADRLDNDRGKLGSAHDRATQALDAAAGIARDAHSGMTTIENAWHSDKLALGPISNTPQGQAALLQAGMQRVSETQSLVFGVTTRFGDLATNVGDAITELPTPLDAETSTPSKDTPADTDEDSGADEDSSQTAQTEEFNALGGPLEDEPTTFPSSATDAAPITRSAGLGSGSPMESLLSSMGSGGMPSMGQLPLSGGVPGGGAAGLSSLLQPLIDAAGSTDSTSESDDSAEDDNHAGVAWNGTEAQKAIKTAEQALGLPYVWGGGGAAGPSGGGFDCSGLTQWAFAQATDGRIILPRTTYDQINMGQNIAPANIRPGDLVFSNFSAPGVPEHVSLYVGDGKIIEAQQTGVPVKYSTAPTDDIVVRRVL